MSLVDVIIPACNAERSVARTIESVRAQLFGDWIPWVVDADNRLCAGQPALGLILRALHHCPAAVVSWKVLARCTVRRLIRLRRPCAGLSWFRQLLLPAKEGRRP